MTQILACDQSSSATVTENFRLSPGRISGDVMQRQGICFGVCWIHTVTRCAFPSPKLAMSNSASRCGSFGASARTTVPPTLQSALGRDHHWYPTVTTAVTSATPAATHADTAPHSIP